MSSFIQGSVLGTEPQSTFINLSPIMQKKKKKKRSVRQNRYFYTQLRDEDVEVQNGRPRNSTNLNRGDWIPGGGGFWRAGSLVSDVLALVPEYI